MSSVEELRISWSISSSTLTSSRVAIVKSQVFGDVDEGTRNAFQNQPKARKPWMSRNLAGFKFGVFMEIAMSGFNWNSVLCKEADDVQTGNCRRTV
jgi:hypothetical protein